LALRLKTLVGKHSIKILYFKAEGSLRPQLIFFEKTVFRMSLVMRKELSVLGNKDASEASQVWEYSFATARGFSASKQASRWLPADNFYPVLGLRHDGKLVSVMRVEWVLNFKELAYKIKDCPQELEVEYPAVYLTKAGTVPECREMGLNLTLRYFSFLLAERWGASYMLGTMVEGSPRIRSMVEMGYEFQKLPNNWKGLYQSEMSPLVAVLDLKKNREKAFQYLADKTSNYRQDLHLSTDISQIEIQNNNMGIRWPWLE
jgi:hypothetical protein